MSDKIIDNIGSAIKDIKIGNGFKAVPLDAAQAEKLKQSRANFAAFVAATGKEAAVVRVATTADGIAVHVQFPLTAALPNNVTVETLEKLLVLGAFLPESGLVLDPKARLVWNFYNEFKANEDAQAQQYVTSVLAQRRRLRPDFLAELQKMGLTIDLSAETELQNAAGTPIKLTPEQLQQITQGGFLRSFGVGLAFGLASAAIDASTAGAATVPLVVLEAGYGTALS